MELYVVLAESMEPVLLSASLCVGDGRPVMSHFGGVTVMTSFLNSSPSHSCIWSCRTAVHHRLTGLLCDGDKYSRIVYVW